MFQSRSCGTLCVGVFVSDTGSEKYTFLCLSESKASREISQAFHQAFGACKRNLRFAHAADCACTCVCLQEGAVKVMSGCGGAPSAKGAKTCKRN